MNAVFTVYAVFTVCTSMEGDGSIGGEEERSGGEEEQTLLMRTSINRPALIHGPPDRSGTASDLFE